MPRTAIPARTRIIEAAYTLFYTQGYSQSGIDDIAAAAGLTKRTLYQHFDSKDALIAAVMEHDVALSMPRLSRWIEAVEVNLEAGIDARVSDLAAWAQMPGWMGSGFTRIVMELAGPSTVIRCTKIARAHKKAIETRLARAIGFPERAGELMIILEGHWSCCSFNATKP